MQKPIYIIICIFCFACASCSGFNKNPEALLVSTLDTLEKTQDILAALDKNAKPEEVISAISSPVMELNALNRMWTEMDNPFKLKWKSIMEKYSARLLNVAAELREQHLKFDSMETRRTVHKSITCWIFGNETVAEYAPLLFTSETTENYVRAIIRNSSNSMWFDETNKKNIRFLQAGLIVQFIDDHVSAVKKLPFSSSDRKELIEIMDSLTKHGGDLSGAPAGEITQELRRELSDN